MSTGIEWTDETWNPTRGCTPVSPGCDNCYAQRQAIRQAGKGPYKGLVVSGEDGPKWTGRVVFDEGALVKPMGWVRPRRVFVDSMSDLFHPGISDREVAAVYGVMAATPRHTYQVLTKRSSRLPRWYGWVEGDAHDSPDMLIASCAADRTVRFDQRAAPWPLPNLHLGVSVENNACAVRIDRLLSVPAAVRFASVEPLLEEPGEEMLFRLTLLDWVIVGGESGPGARPMAVEWVNLILARCAKAGVPVFVKQLGSRPTRHGKPLPLVSVKGGHIDEWPTGLRVRQWPTKVAPDFRKPGCVDEIAGVTP